MNIAGRTLRGFWMSAGFLAAVGLSCGVAGAADKTKVDAATKQVLIGHKTPRGGWVTDAAVAATITVGTDYTLGVSLRGSTVNVTLNGQSVLGFVLRVFSIIRRAMR